MFKVPGLETSTDTSEQAEQTRKILRLVAEAVRRIEEHHQAATRVEEVFSTELLVLRTRLKDLSWKLIQKDPLKNGSKALDIFWRKAFHEPVTLSRQLRGGNSQNDGWTELQRYLLEGHLLSGCGLYHHLIVKLAHFFGWDNSLLQLDFNSQDVGYGFGFPPHEKRRSELSTTDVKQWVEGSVHRCLVFLGDLARYRLEFNLGDDDGARRYYQLAVTLKPGGGAAYNQLATLAGEANHGLDQLFYYFRCVCSQDGFEGGEANLRRMLDKSAAKFEGGKEDEPGINIVKSLLQLCYLMIVKEEEQEAVTQACQQNLAFLHQLLLVEQTKIVLSGPWLSLTVCVVVMMIVRMREQKDKSVRISLCQAWLLALLSHLANMVVGKVGRQLWGEEWQEPSVEPPEEGEKDVTEKTDVSLKEGAKKKKNRLEELLRRRRSPQSVSEGDNSGESSDEIFESDTDDDELSNSCLVESSDSDSELDVVIEDKEEEHKSLPSSLDLVRTAEETGLLAPLKLCLSWLQYQPDVLSQTGSGSDQLWVNLARLFSVLNLSQAEDKLVSSPQVVKVMEKGNTGPLWEDWLLRGVWVNNELDWGKNGVVKDEMVVRVVQLAKMKNWLCEHKDSKISWDVASHRAFIRKQHDEKEEKKNVMKHMAELWLRQEVAELEEKHQNDEGGLLVIDGTALSTNLHMVKRVLGLKHYNLVVPVIAVQQLDGLKKGKRGAREAIRWLERELGRGNRWIRAQKEDESKKIEGEAPRQRDREEWDRWQLAECLYYFLSKEEGSIVTLLTGDTYLLAGQGPVSSLGPLLRVENIEGFVPRISGVQGDGRKNGHQGDRRQSGDQGDRRKSGDGMRGIEDNKTAG